MRLLKIAGCLLVLSCMTATSVVHAQMDGLSMMGVDSDESKGKPSTQYPALEKYEGYQVHQQQEYQQQQQQYSPQQQQQRAQRDWEWQHQQIKEQQELKQREWEKEKRNREREESKQRQQEDQMAQLQQMMWNKFFPNAVSPWRISHPYENLVPMTPYIGTNSDKNRYYSDLEYRLIENLAQETRNPTYKAEADSETFNKDRYDKDADYRRHVDQRIADRKYWDEQPIDPSSLNESLGGKLLAKAHFGQKRIDLNRYKTDELFRKYIDSLPINGASFDPDKYHRDPAYRMKVNTEHIRHQINSAVGDDEEARAELAGRFMSDPLYREMLRAGTFDPIFSTRR